MSRAFALAALLSVALVAGPLRAEPPLWTIEDGSRVGFQVRQSGAPVEAWFDRFEGEIRFDPAQLETSRLWIEIETGSVNSQSSDRDSTIRSRDLFDVETWPTARFEVDGFRHEGGEAYEAQGRLTLRDMTLALALPFALTIEPHPSEAGAEQATATGEVTLLRLDYGVGQGQWQDTSMVPNEVLVRFEILAKRPRE